MNYESQALLTDLYEITMMQGYFTSGLDTKQGVFDLYYRSNPFGNGFSITAGLAQVVDYVKGLRFSVSDIEYLNGLNMFRGDFLDYLRSFRFSGDIYAIPEGTVVFPTEPLLRVKSTLMEAQLMEAALLNIMNHQSLIATKASRVKWAAQDDDVLEFGLRRAQGPDAGVYGARAAVIGGCLGTSNVLAGKMFGVPVRGTHAHSWIMSFPDELSAFRAYARTYPNAAILLVDTYNSIKSGVPNAIQVFKEMKEAGIELRNYGIRLDSGDLAYLSKKAREALDEAGFTDAVISGSSDLDENLIESLKHQGAAITVWGVGTNLITSKGCPAFGGVYKLCCEIDADGTESPKIKLSDNPEKITNPGIKKVFRLYDRTTGMIRADLIALDHETYDENEDLTVFDPIATWKKLTLEGGSYRIRELLEPVFLGGECVYKDRAVMDIAEQCRLEQETLWDEQRRIVNPQGTYVDLSQELFDLKKRMIDEHGSRV